MEAVFVVLGFVIIVGVVLLTTRKADPLELDPADQRDVENTDDADHAGNTGDESVSTLDPRDLRFSVVTRGYRMDEVDAVIERLVNDVAERDAEIQRLHVASDMTTRTSTAQPATGLPRRTVTSPHPESTSPAQPTPHGVPEEPERDVFGRPIPPDTH